MRRYTGGIAYDIEVDKSGNVYVAGVTGLSNYTLLKYNNNGILLWSSTTQAYPFADRVSITLDSAGNIYLGGVRQSNLVLIKYNTNGIEQWTAFYPQGSVNDITLDKYDNVYVTGEIYSPTSYRDFLTLKYSQPIGIEPISNELPDVFKLHQNFPNPFNPTTKIKFSVPKTSFISIKIYNILGSEIATLTNAQLQSGTYEADWSADMFSSGVYFYKLIADGKIIDTKKMILIK